MSKHPLLITSALAVAVVAITFLLVTLPSFAQDEPARSDQSQETEEEIAVELNNPVGSVWNIVLQNNLTLLNGDITTKNRVRWVTNFQPVLPIPVTRKWNLITRPILPVVSAPVPQPDGTFDQQGGLGDAIFQLFVSPNKRSGFIWGLGPLFSLPTATKTALGSSKWSAGPVGLGLISYKGIVAGALVSQLWSYAGKSSREDVSVGSLQYFATYVFPSTWQVGLGTPIIVADWKADKGDRWTVPVGLSVGKLFNIGIPFQVSLEASYAVVHPDTFGERWNFRLILKPVVPALIKNPIFGN